MFTLVGAGKEGTLVEIVHAGGLSCGALVSVIIVQTGGLCELWCPCICHGMLDLHGVKDGGLS